jgi:hypothetical protein
MIHPIVFLSTLLVVFPPLVFLSWVAQTAMFPAGHHGVRPQFARVSLVTCAMLALLIAWQLAR